MKYKAMLHLLQISKVKVERETAKSVWINGDRYEKTGETITFFDTFEDAKNWMIDSKKAHIRRIEKTLQGIQMEIEEIKSLK